MINSNSLKGESPQASLRRFTTPALFAFVLALINTPVPSRAATPPPTTLLYTAPASASIHGGVATIGTSGVTYFSILSTGTTRARVIKLSAGGTPLWTFTAPGDGTGYDMYAIPALDAAGAKLYIGSDAGIFYCLNTSDGSVAWSYPVPTGTDKRIRSGAALDPNNLLGSTVYFHCNNGYLYALNASTGAQRWTAATGNGGGPPTAPDPGAPGGDWDPHPASSSPVVDSSGVVYVGSADGSVYAFNPSNGSRNWRVVLNISAVEPVEATIAIGRDGILFVGTRVNPANGFGGNVYAINPVTHTVIWPSFIGRGVGFIASPVIDQSGFVYATHFDHNIFKLKAADGSLLQNWFFSGKLCQTPTINQNGLLIFGVSAMGFNEVNEIAAVNTADPNSISPFWEITQTGGQNFGNSFGSPAIVCVSGGTAYFADTLGKVCSFDTGASMMAGTWPTFECGNRRAGKTITYPTAIAQLPAYYENAFTDVHRLDTFGRAVGQAQGYYDEDCGYLDTGYAAALWRNNGISVPGGCEQLTALANTYAYGINAIGDVVGYYPNGLGYALVWPDGANSSTYYTILPDPSGYDSAIATCINSASTIYGTTWSGPSYHLARWAKSGDAWPTAENKGAPPGDYAYAYGMSESERIVGQARFAAGAQLHAFVTFPQGSSFTDLGTFGGLQSIAVDVNDQSGTVGYAQNSSGYFRAFLAPIDCGTLNAHPEYQLPQLPGVTRLDWRSYAYGVNGFSQVVGSAQDQNLAYRAYIYKPGQGGVIDLNTITLDGGQTPASLGWTLTSAKAINDAGVIVGQGSQNSASKAWILYPLCQD